MGQSELHCNLDIGEDAQIPQSAMSLDEKLIRLLCPTLSNLMASISQVSRPFTMLWKRSVSVLFLVLE